MRRTRGFLPVALLGSVLLGATLVYFGVARKLWSSPEPTVSTAPVAPAPEPPTPAPEPPAEPAPPAPPSEFEEARRAFDARDWAAARPAIARAISAVADAAQRGQLLEWGIEANRHLVYGDPAAADIVLYTIRQGDTLGSIARRHHTTLGAIRLLNNVPDNRIRAGDLLTVPTGRLSLYAVKSQFRLYILYEGIPLKAYPVAIGRDGATPAATYTVGQTSPQPDWFPPPAVQRDLGVAPRVPYGDPQNPLGTHWLALDHARHRGFGIHGTNDDSVIGTQATYGCIRMHNADVADLFDIAEAGMTVVVVD